VLGGTAFWTGRAALLVGGTASSIPGRGYSAPLNAAVFDPATGSWRALSPPVALDVTPAASGAVAWAGVLIVAANAGHGPGGPAAAAWDPGTGQWIRLPAPPAVVTGGPFLATGVWTGREFIFPAGAGLVTFTPAS
jgi:hypothetical protein